MVLFYVLSFFKKGDTIQGGTLFNGGTLFKEIWYLIPFWLVWADIKCTVHVALSRQPINQFSKADNRC